VELSKEEEVLSKELSLLTAKPVLVVINAGEGEIKKNGWGGGRDGEKMKEKGINIKRGTSGGDLCQDGGGFE